MKKLIILTVLALVIGSWSIANASTSQGTRYFNKGWNMVYGFGLPDLIIGGELTPQNIKAVYILKQPAQEFVRVFPNPDSVRLDGVDDDYYEKAAQLVYTDKAGSATYRMEEPLPPQFWNEHQVYKGWNLIGLTNYRVEGPTNPDLQLADIKGTCNIEKAYDMANNRWVPFNMPEMDSTLLWGGLLVKVSNNCFLGLTAPDTTILPPALP